MTSDCATYKMDQEREGGGSAHPQSQLPNAHLSSLNLSISEMSTSNGTKGVRTAIVLYTMHGHISSRESDMCIVSRLRFADPMS